MQFYAIKERTRIWRFFLARSDRRTDISRRPERSDRRVERGSVVGITGFVMNPSLIVIGYLPLNDGRGRRLGHFGSFSGGAKKKREMSREGLRIDAHFMPFPN